MDSKKNVSMKQYIPYNYMCSKKCVFTTAMGFLIIGATVASVIIDPVDVITRYCIRIDNDTQMYNKLHEKMNSITIKMHLFNITNAERFLSGQDRKLKIEEVGPFTFKESRENLDIELDKEKNLLRYTPNSTLTFVPEESIADPKDVTVVVPNIVFLSFASTLAKQPFWVKTAFDLLSLKQNSKPLLTMSAHDYLFGYEEPLIAMTSTIMPGVVFYDKLGLLSFGFNPKRNVRLELDISEEKKFQVRKSNGLGGITRLGFQKQSTDCNTFNDAYEGFLFPYNLSPERRIRIYYSFFCRLLDLEYVKNRTLEDGTETLEYRISQTAYENTTSTKCLCSTGNCYRGTSDMSPCFDGLPLSLSHGHFLHAEDRVFDRIEGLRPDQNTHGSQFLIHKHIGLTLNTSFSVQVNIVMNDVNYMSATKPFSNMVIPFTWVKVEQQQLPDDIKTMLKFVDHYLPKIALLTQIILFIIGCSLLTYALRHVQKTPYSSQLNMEYCKPDLEKESPLPTEKQMNFANKYYGVLADRGRTP